jgi:hypothetical protein
MYFFILGFICSFLGAGSVLLIYSVLSKINKPIQLSERQEYRAMIRQYMTLCTVIKQNNHLERLSSTLMRDTEVMAEKLLDKYRS